MSSPGPAGPAPGPDWLDAFADAVGVARTTADDRAAVLDLARVVAHGTGHRADAPVAAYVAGLAAAAGLVPADALARAEQLLGPGGGDPE